MIGRVWFRTRDHHSSMVPRPSQILVLLLCTRALVVVVAQTASTTSAASTASSTTTAAADTTAAEEDLEVENKKGRFVNLYRILHNKPTGGIRQCKKLCKKCRTPPECKQIKINKRVVGKRKVRMKLTNGHKCNLTRKKVKKAKRKRKLAIYKAVCPVRVKLVGERKGWKTVHIRGRMALTFDPRRKLVTNGKLAVFSNRRKETFHILPCGKKCGYRHILGRVKHYRT